MTSKRGAAHVPHGADTLPSVVVHGYNAELRSGKGFLGDRASNSAFRAALDKARERLREDGEDPLGDEPTDELSKQKLDTTLRDGDPEAAALIQGVIEEFAGELAKVTARFRRLKAWRDVTCVVVGGGLRASRVGELAIGRASLLLKDSGLDVRLRPIRNHPDQAGLIGAAHLVPRWMFAGHDAILALDIGGTNIRAGLVELHLEQSADLSAATVHTFTMWRYREDEVAPTRDTVVAHIGEMLADLVREGEKSNLKLAPFVGVGCPGRITAEGLIPRGGQNLPGNWESSRFNLPLSLREHLPTIGGEETVVVMHNDAVVQGLSDAPFVADAPHWAVLTLGTGLGNAAFETRRDVTGS